MFCIISLFIIFVGFEKIDYISDMQVVNPEAAKTSSDDVIVAYSPVTVKYDKNDMYHSLDFESSDDLYFDYEDVKKLEDSELVEEVILVPSNFNTGNSQNIENNTIKPTNLIYNDIEYNFTNLLIPKELYTKIPFAFDYSNIVVEGEYPDDYTNQILVPMEIADYLISTGTINSYSDLIGQVVTLDVLLCDENVVCEVPSTMDFEISGISNDSQIAYAYQNEQLTIENQGYLALQDPSYNPEEVYEIAYLNANRYYEYQNEELDYEEFKANNADLIEGVYIKVKDPNDVEEVQNTILNSYPYAVLASKEVFSNPPPLYTLKIPIKEAIKQITILLLILIFTFFVIFRTFFKRQHYFTTVSNIVGVSKKEIFKLRMLEYLIVVAIPLFVSLIINLIVMSGNIHIASFIWFIVVAIVSFVVLLGASKFKKYQ